MFVEEREQGPVSYARRNFRLFLAFFKIFNFLMRKLNWEMTLKIFRGQIFEGKRLKKIFRDIFREKITTKYFCE